MSKLERRLRDSKETSYFLRYAKNYTSQGGEDGIIEELFNRIGTTDSPYCIDIGAWDGQHLSNTYTLLNSKQWNGLLVEANVERAKSLEQLYIDRPNIHIKSCLVTIEGENSLLNLMNSVNVPKDFDFITIDVDGADYHLWKSIGLFFKPRVVCIEFNPSIQNQVYFVQESSTTVHEGSSLLAIYELGVSLGYQLVVTTTFNAFFVRADLVRLLPLSSLNNIIYPFDNKNHRNENNENTDLLPVDLNRLHNCAMSSDLFQTYNGELHLTGPKKLLWHRKSINIQLLQPIKQKKLRLYPFSPPLQQSAHNLENNLTQVRLILMEFMVLMKSYIDLDDARKEKEKVFSSNFQNSFEMALNDLLIKKVEKEKYENVLAERRSDVLIAVSLMLLYCSDLIRKANVQVAPFSWVFHLMEGFWSSVALVFEEFGNELINLRDGAEFNFTDSQFNPLNSKEFDKMEQAVKWFKYSLFIGVLRLYLPVETVNQDEFQSFMKRINSKISSFYYFISPPLSWELNEKSTKNNELIENLSLKDSLEGLFWNNLGFFKATKTEFFKTIEPFNKKMKNKMENEILIKGISEENNLMSFNADYNNIKSNEIQVSQNDEKLDNTQFLTEYKKVAHLISTFGEEMNSTDLLLRCLIAEKQLKVNNNNLKEDKWIWIISSLAFGLSVGAFFGVLICKTK